MQGCGGSMREERLNKIKKQQGCSMMIAEEG